MDLRITKRAIDDLGLSEELLDRDVSEVTAEHTILKAFVERRSQSPIGQEAIQLPRSKQVVYSLHSGRYRGLTWFDDDDDVCWLLGAGYHESGSRDDAYQVLKQRDGAGDLLPTQDDYLSLYRWRRQKGALRLDDLVSAVAGAGPRLLETATSNPGTPVRELLEEVLDVELLVEELHDERTVIRQYTVVFVMPPRKPGVLPSGTSWQTLLVFAFLPSGADISNLEWRTDSRGERVIYIEIE